ncbi:hypothetical protein M427DRAFT_154342, partial [Gonapodya prolifera JEL478]
MHTPRLHTPRLHARHGRHLLLEKHTRQPGYDILVLSPAAQDQCTTVCTYLSTCVVNAMFDGGCNLNSAAQNAVTDS